MRVMISTGRNETMRNLALRQTGWAVPRPRPKSEVSPKWHCEVTSYDRRDKNKHTKSGGEHKILRQLVVRLHSQLPVRYRAACCLALEYGRTSGVRISTEPKFLSTLTSKPALKPTQPPTRWVLKTLGLEVKEPGREADHFNLVRGLRMSGALPPFSIYVFVAFRDFFYSFSVQGKEHRPFPSV